MRVYLVRHGQTAWNAEARCQGHTDIPLDEQGQEQARLLAEAFQHTDVRRIFSSDLQRTLQTAQPLADRLGLQLEPCPALRERSFGEWEGTPFEFIAERFIEEGQITGKEREEIRPPGGESSQDVWDRLASIVEHVAETDEPTVVVSHGGSAALLLARLLRGTIFTARAFRFDNTGITTVNRRPDGGFQLLSYNDSSHLRRPALVGSLDGSSR